MWIRRKGLLEGVVAAAAKNRQQMEKMVSIPQTDESGDGDNTDHVLVLLNFSDPFLLPLASPIYFDRNMAGMCNICPRRVEQKVEPVELLLPHQHQHHPAMTMTEAEHPAVRSGLGRCRTTRWWCLICIAPLHHDQFLVEKKSPFLRLRY